MTNTPGILRRPTHLCPGRSAVEISMQLTVKHHAAIRAGERDENSFRLIGRRLGVGYIPFAAFSSVAVESS